MENNSQINQDPSVIDVTREGEIINYDHLSRVDEQYNSTLGEEYRQILGLDDYYVDILNKLWYPSNNFSSIPFCKAEIVKMFVLILDDLSYKFKKQNTTIEIQFNVIADLVTFKHLSNGMNEYSYKYKMLSSINDIFNNIFKHAENALRNHYGHTRKISTEIDYSDQEINEEYERRITSKILQILPIWVPRVNMPDQATDILLYTQNSARWKLRFEEICAECGKDAKEFMSAILDLGRLNVHNPSLELIYFEASKYITTTDQEVALRLYIYYIHADLLSSTFDNRQHNKTIQKSLFKTGEQLKDFQAVISQLILDQDLEIALNAVSSVLSKRKRIKLDLGAIAAISEKHSGTVELLNKYLQDDYEDEFNTIKIQEFSNEELSIAITPKKQGAIPSIFIDTINLTTIQMDVIHHFAKSNFAVPQKELELIAKANGVFKNQLVDSINEACYDAIDDVIIEEEEDNYFIHETYYQKILSK